MHHCPAIDDDEIGRKILERQRAATPQPIGQLLPDLTVADLIRRGIFGGYPADGAGIRRVSRCFHLESAIVAHCTCKPMANEGHFALYLQPLWIEDWLFTPVWLGRCRECGTWWWR